jgi:hypothetical protein
MINPVNYGRNFLKFLGDRPPLIEGSRNPRKIPKFQGNPGKTNDAQNLWTIPCKTDILGNYDSLFYFLHVLLIF